MDLRSWVARGRTLRRPRRRIRRGVRRAAIRNANEVYATALALVLAQEL